MYTHIRKYIINWIEYAWSLVFHRNDTWEADFKLIFEDEDLVE